jgi:hypothetical protein
MQLYLRVALSAAVLLSATLCPASEAEEPEQRSVWSSVDVQLYGYVKLDAAYDTDRAVPGNFVRWVELDPDSPDDDEFNMTANETRVGLRFSSDEDDQEGSLQTGARLEIDFYGGGAENKPRPMLRHAYLILDWPKSRWQLLAGQTSDLISPLYPKTLNYPVAWWAGNIGYRRPQIRLTKTTAPSKRVDFHLVGALTRDIGSTSSDFVGVDAGTDSGLPGVQARVGWQFDGGELDPIGVGLSGHWAQEEFDTTATGDAVDFDSWSVNLDYKHPISRKVTLQAEVFTGANLAAYLGGIGQGVNVERKEEIGTAGGWLSLDVGPFDKLTYHLGVTQEDVDDEDLDSGGRSRNGSIFANGVFSLTGHVQMGLELSYWSTDYKDAEEATDFRVQYSIYYRF